MIMGESDHEPTVFQNLSIPHKKNVLSLSVDPSGRFTSCLSENSLSIIDLEYPWEIFTSHRLPTKVESPIVQWNPKENLIATTSNNDTIIWGFDNEHANILSIIPSHQNQVCDIAWSPLLPNLIATCSYDKYAYIWDIRINNSNTKPSKLKTFCGWTQSITNIQWNRIDCHQIVVSQENKIFVYDTRKEGHHLSTFESHKNDITSIDCSYHSKNFIITSSTVDKSIRIWDLTSLSSPSCVYQVEGHNFDKVKYSPFKGYFVSSQNDSSLHLWSTKTEDKLPFKTFQCHTNILPSFDWRACTIDDTVEYQLVSWSDDGHLKLWTIDSSRINKNYSPIKTLDLNHKEPSKFRSSDSQSSSWDEAKVNEILDQTKEENVPGPRLFGARFVGSGLLLSYGCRNKKTSNHHLEYCKTYDDFLTVYGDQNTKSSNTIKQYFYSPNMIYFSSKRAQNGSDADIMQEDSIAIPIPPPHQHKSTYEWQKFVNIYETTLNSTQFSLATQYIFNGKNTSLICNENAKIANKVGRKDLVKLWTLLSFQTDPLVYNDAKPSFYFDTPWSNHPLGRNLVSSLIKHYEKHQDLQTVAMIVRVLSHSEKGIDDINNTLLNQTNKDKYDLIRKTYADLLFRWKLYTKRSEVLKNMTVNKETSAEQTLNFGVICRKCKQNLVDPVCGKCNIHGLNCSICHNFVKGNGSYCFLCGHGGHSKHLEEWFSNNSLCPSGCNCKCTLSEYK